MKKAQQHVSIDRMAVIIVFFYCAALPTPLGAVPATTESCAGEGSNSVIKVQLLCNEPGRLRVDLVNEVCFGDPDRPLMRQELLLGDHELSQLITFTFKGLEPGRYALRAFIDRNGDGRLNAGLFGPTEPWALSWSAGMKRSIPRFEDLAFQAAIGITTIQMELKK